MPILGIILFYNIFKVIGVKRFNPRLFKLRFNPNFALIISFLCNLLILSKFDLNNFFNGNVDEIRSGFNQFDVGLLDQILPVLLVYPSAYLIWMLAKPKAQFDWKFYGIAICVILFGVSSGGRAFLFIFLLLYIFIAKPKIFTVKNILSGFAVIFLFGFITIGRISKDLEFDPSAYIEASAPLEFNKSLKDDTLNPNVRNIIVQTVFYFGHSVPAFCNKVENLDIEILPRSIFGLQPFVERQLIRVGVLGHDQNQRYLEMLSLAKKSGFFEQSWSTTFLDVYFQEGIIFSIVFFLGIAMLLYQSNLNLSKTNSVKYKIITGFNVVFIITFFLTPAFMDTTWFFTYITFLICNDKNVLLS